MITHAFFRLQGIKAKAVMIIGAVVCVVSLARSQPTKQWSQGNPSNEEQYALETINRVRMNPVAAGEFYAGLYASDPILKAAIDSLNVRSANNLIMTGAGKVVRQMQIYLDDYNQKLSLFQTAAPKPPLALYPLFSEQARSQGLAALSSAPSSFNGEGPFVVSNANLPTSMVPIPSFLPGFFPVLAPSLTGSNATGGTAVVRRGLSNGNQGGYARGQLLYLTNLYDARLSAREAVITSQGLQSYLRDSFTSEARVSGNGFIETPGKANMVGISIAPGAANRIMTLFATDNEAFQTSDLPFGVDTVFITGVVYDDQNKDGEYDLGEGLSSLSVTPNTGEWLAATSTSGGYSIPVRKNSGTYTVVVKRADGTEVSNVVTVASVNVKLDFVVDTRTKPGQDTIAASTGSTSFVNLSTRGVASKGENALIGGFVVTGTAPKKVLIRGVANSLKAFGLTGVLRKPVLTLYNSAGSVIKQAKTQEIYNPDTGEVNPDVAAVSASVGAFPLSRVVFNGGRFGGDTVIAADLAPGAYTVSIAPDSDTIIYTQKPDGSPFTEEDIFDGFEPVKGTLATNGLVLLEIYDVSPEDTRSRFTNLSSRGRIETGARQMIVGFVLRGTGTRQLLVRGIGPALKGFGVAGALNASALEVFDSNAKPIRSNDNWSTASWSDQSVSVSAAVGAFALSPTSADAVVLMNVAPGLYSAGVKSVSGVPGVGLAEIYGIP